MARLLGFSSKQDWFSRWNWFCVGTDGKWERFSSVSFELFSSPGGEEKVEEDEVVKLEVGLIFSSSATVSTASVSLEEEL